MTKCPYCEKLFNYVRMEAVEGRPPSGVKYACIAYSCPYCFKSLGIQMDPIAVKTDTINGVVKALKK